MVAATNLACGIGSHINVSKEKKEKKKVNE